MTLTLEQIAEGRELDDLAHSTFDRTSARAAFAEWLIKHAEALLDAAERVARQEAYAAEPDGYDSPKLADLIKRGKLTPRNTYAEALAEDDAAFARNEFAAGERLASLQKPDDAPKGEPEKPR